MAQAFLRTSARSSGWARSAGLAFCRPSGRPLIILAQLAAANSAETTAFAAVMNNVAQALAFEVLGALIPIIGVGWSLVLAVLV